MKEKPNYYAIIPAEVRYDEDLKANSKLLYGEITCLSNKTGVCYASNNYFARLYKVVPSAITSWINQLKEKGYIDVDYFKENKEIKGRAIRIKGIHKNEYVLTNVVEGYSQKTKDNNTSINNKERNKESEKEEVFDYNWLEDTEE